MLRKVWKGTVCSWLPKVGTLLDARGAVTRAATSMSVGFVGAEIQPSLGLLSPECTGLRPPEPPRRDTVPSIQKGSVYTDSHILLTLSVLENANLQDKCVEWHCPSPFDHGTISLPERARAGVRQARPNYASAGSDPVFI